MTVSNRTQNNTTLASHHKPILLGLAYDDDLGRWAALDTAMGYGVVLPLSY